MAVSSRIALSSLVQVLDVSLSDFDSEQLEGRGIDAPRAGDESDTYALDIEGWVRGRQPVEKVRVTHAGRTLWKAPITRPGEGRFRGAVGTLQLPPEFDLAMSAPLGGGQVAELATLRGRRELLQIDRDPHLQPLIITGFGRSGTSAVTRMLESLPEVVAYDTYRREPSVAAYWMAILTSLAEPRSYRRQTMHGATRGTWWLGAEGGPPSFDEPAIQRLIGVANVEQLAAFCESRVSAFYERLVEEQGGSQVRYFVEKYMPAAVPQVLWDVYREAREVILVRDFRDMAASMLAFGAKRERPFFARDLAASDADFIRRMGGAVSWLDAYRQSRRDYSFLLRYEDLVRKPDEVIPAVLRYLDLDAEAPTATQVHDAFLARSDATEAHRTTADLEASIGRWRRDFDADLQKECEAAFRPALNAFGYAD
jgi:hypothetical protein